jgi:hypothetical protein
MRIGPRIFSALLGVMLAVIGVVLTVESIKGNNVVWVGWLLSGLGGIAVGMGLIWLGLRTKDKPGHRSYRRALFGQLPVLEKPEAGAAGLFKTRVYLFFVGVVFVAIGLICVVLVTEPEARRSLSEEVGFGLPRIIWATLGGAGFTLAIGPFYAAITGRVGKKWILRLMKLLATDVDMR